MNYRLSSTVPYGQRTTNLTWAPLPRKVLVLGRAVVRPESDWAERAARAIRGGHLVWEGAARVVCLNQPVKVTRGSFHWFSFAVMVGGILTEPH